MWVYTDVHIPLIINAPAGILLHFRYVTPDVATLTPCRFVDHTKTLLQQSSRCSLPQPFHFSGHLTLKTGQESKREQERGFFFFFFLKREMLTGSYYSKDSHRGGPAEKHLLGVVAVNWLIRLRKCQKKKRVQGDFFKLLITKSYHLYDQMAQIFNVKLYKLVCWLTDWLRI